MITAIQQVHRHSQRRKGKTVDKKKRCSNLFGNIQSFTNMCTKMTGLDL